MGNILKKQRFIDEALKNYRIAIEIDPKLREAYNEIGLTLKDQE
jgi:hypothetical protein